MPWAQLEAALAPAFARRDRPGKAIPGSDLFGTALEIAGVGVSAAGRPRLPIRLMAALLYLKHAFNLRDEELVVRGSENVVCGGGTSGRIRGRPWSQRAVSEEPSRCDGA